MNDETLRLASATPSSTGEIVVPDTIEPIMGWKALRILPDGRLASPQQDTIWPVKQRCEATCKRVVHSWQAVRTDRPNDAPPVVTGNAGSTMMVSATAVSSVSYVSGMVPAHGTMNMYPAVQPTLVLPHGYKWSWEPSSHDPAQADCSCGIYVVTDPRQCSGYLKSDCVLAEVAVWGNVVPASEGARGQYAYPQKLYSLEHLADVAVLVCDLYGVPLEVRANERPGLKRPTPPPVPHLFDPPPPPEPLLVKPAPDPKHKLGTQPGRPEAARTIAIFVYMGLLSTVLILTLFLVGGAAVLAAVVATMVTMLAAIFVLHD